MLTKKQRLSRSEFAHVLKRGQRVHGAHMVVVYAPSPAHAEDQVSQVKCGVVVSKKTARKAVTRHQVRRKVYDALQTLLPVLIGCHVAILTKQNIATRNSAEVYAELKELVARMR